MDNHHTNDRRYYGQTDTYRPFPPRPPRPPENVLATQEIIIERKSYQISRRENARGQFIVISEAHTPSPSDQPGSVRRPNRIIIPLAGISDITLALQKVCTAGNQK